MPHKFSLLLENTIRIIIPREEIKKYPIITSIEIENYPSEYQLGHGEGLKRDMTLDCATQKGIKIILKRRGIFSLKSTHGKINLRKLWYDDVRYRELHQVTYGFKNSEANNKKMDLSKLIDPFFEFEKDVSFIYRPKMVNVIFN